MLACSCEPFIHPPSKLLQELVSQDDASCPISCNASRELSHPLLDISDKDDEREKQDQHQEAEQEEREEQEEHSHNSSSNGDSDNNHDQDGNDSDGLRPAKRLRLSRSSRDRALKRICKRRLRQSRDSRSALVRAELECASLRSQKSSTRSSFSDEEPMSHTSAEYQEWPMHGFLKRTTIGDEIRYSMEFSLEQLYKLCALAGPQHTSQAGSATGSAGSSRLPAQARKTRSGLPSQIKGTRFTEEEDAKLIDMKAIKCLSWDKIEGAFLRRTRATLQVHYSTKLKHRASLGKRPRANKQSGRHALQ